MQKVELYFLLSERHQTEIRNCSAHVTLKQTWFQLETRLMKNDLNARGVEDSGNRASVVLGPSDVERPVDDKLLSRVRVDAVCAMRLQMVEDVGRNLEVLLSDGLEELVDFLRVQGVQLKMVVDIAGRLEVDQRRKGCHVEVGSDLGDDQEELASLLEKLHPPGPGHPAPTERSVVVVGLQSSEEVIGFCHVSGLDQDEVG